MSETEHDPDLVAFVMARNAEDQAAAEAAQAADWQTWQRDEFSDQPEALIAHFNRHAPARALRSVAAVRAILDTCQSTMGNERRQEGAPDAEMIALRAGVLLDALRLLASAWSDHPDYKASWS